jgi:hypothetical protein
VRKLNGTLVENVRVFNHKEIIDVHQVRSLKNQLNNVPILDRDRSTVIGLVIEATWHLNDFILANVLIFEKNKQAAKLIANNINDYEVSDGKIISLIVR